MPKTLQFKAVMIIKMHSTIFIVLSSTARSHIRSFEWKSTSAKRPPTRRPSCKLDFWVRLLAAIGRIFTHYHFVSVLNHKVDTHLPSLGGWRTQST